MKKVLIVFLGVVIVIGVVVANILITTGFFREINNSTNYEVIAEIPMKGAEDFTVDYEAGFMIISQDDRAARLYSGGRSGNIYYLDLKTDKFEPIDLTPKLNIPLFPHGISLLKLDSAHYQLLVINHAKKHTIEKFELFGDSLVHIQTYEDEAMISPNDVVAIDKDKFYFSNDHGSTSKTGVFFENYLGLRMSNVMFFDGDRYEKVVDGIAYANGVNISPDGSQLLLASPRDFELSYYDIETDYSLTMNRKLEIGTGVDNIEFDPDGNVWIGCHPNLLEFAAYAKGDKPISPSEIIQITRGDEIRSVFVDDGSRVSASTVAAPYNDLLFVGTVMDDNLVVLRKKH
ncbi:MAG: SMP-30/gluconolactonase/LRE family protein [Ekhidna sp.]